MIPFLLNVPYTVIGIVCALVSLPQHVAWDVPHRTLVFKAKTNWWLYFYARHARGIAMGHVVILFPNCLPNDLAHELIHVEQHDRYPIIFTILYMIESFKHGYRNNRFEAEAYERTQSIYIQRTKNYSLIGE